MSWSVGISLAGIGLTVVLGLLPYFDVRPPRWILASAVTLGVCLMLVWPLSFGVLWLHNRPDVMTARVSLLLTVVVGCAIGGTTSGITWRLLESKATPPTPPASSTPTSVPVQPTPPPAPVAPPVLAPSEVRLFVECESQWFPIEIPAGSVARVLRIHPSTLKDHTRLLGLQNIGAPQDKARIWPTDEEAAPLPSWSGGKTPEPNFYGVKCTVRKYGVGTVDDIVIAMMFFGSPYNLVIDPLESSGSFDRFTFYLVNACYLDLASGFSFQLPPVVTQFPQSATAHVLGEPVRRTITVKKAWRDDLPPHAILLLPSNRRWKDLPPC